MNIDVHMQQIRSFAGRTKSIVISFRYCSTIDKHSVHCLEELFEEKIKKGIFVLLTYIDEDVMMKLNMICGEEWVEKNLASKKFICAIKMP